MQAPGQGLSALRSHANTPPPHTHTCAHTQMMHFLPIDTCADIARHRYTPTHPPALSAYTCTHPSGDTPRQRHTSTHSTLFPTHMRAHACIDTHTPAHKYTYTRPHKHTRADTPGFRDTPKHPTTLPMHMHTHVNRNPHTLILLVKDVHRPAPRDLVTGTPTSTRLPHQPRPPHSHICADAPSHGHTSTHPSTFPTPHRYTNTHTCADTLRYRPIAIQPCPPAPHTHLSTPTHAYTPGQVNSAMDTHVHTHRHPEYTHRPTHGHVPTNAHPSTHMNVHAHFYTHIHPWTHTMYIPDGHAQTRTHTETKTRTHVCALEDNVYPTHLRVYVKHKYMPVWRGCAKLCEHCQHIVPYGQTHTRTHEHVHTHTHSLPRAIC